MKGSALRDRGLPIALDAVFVVAFVVLGRRSHAEGSAVAGTLSVAWPFLLGMLIGHALLWAGKLSDWSLPAGAAVVTVTVLVGMILRHTTSGGGTPFSFVLVATIVLTIFMIGWRAARRIAPRA